MVGFGSEDSDFVFEIVYNYGVDKLLMGAKKVIKLVVFE